MKLAIVAAFGAALLATAATAVTAAGPEGTWMSQDGDTKVRIVNCGGGLCGRVVWLGEPIDSDTGKPKTDKRNPDPDKRARPLLGLQVVSGMKASGPNRWSGAIYNADDGRTYAANFEVKNERVARLEGCVLGVICKAHTWTRAN